MSIGNSSRAVAVALTGAASRFVFRRHQYGVNGHGASPDGTGPEAPGSRRARWTAWTRRLLKRDRLQVILAHIVLIVIANYLAFWLRFDGAIPEVYQLVWIATIPWLVAVRAVTFVPFHLYQGIWQYAGSRDLRAILGGVFTSTAMFYVLVHGVWGLVAYPRLVLVTDSILLVFFMGGIRLLSRPRVRLRRAARRRRVLIFGAGDAGAMIVREIVNRRSHEFQPVGFIDDDETKVGRRIHGVPVLGTRKTLGRVILQTAPSEVLIAIPRATPAMLRGVVKSLEPYSLPIKALPYLRDLLDGRATVGDIRDLAIADLLGRAPVELDPGRIKPLIAGKRIMVTGAGGSIGSELSRQLAALGPSHLILFERYENALWAVEQSLRGTPADVAIHPVIGDVTDERRVEEVLLEHRPQMILHAAAHKHVPLMELNPCEAIKNNIKGTRMLGEAAVRHGVDRFVLISSDKAVNPSSVMGATKRVAEILTLGLAEAGGTCFVVVRFGNVMGSNGSVIPLFLDQIRRGGPVTITHPEMRRYFMLIPEAVQLVLQAGAQGENGSVYVLDMGEEIKVLDMARSLIRLSGFIPDKDIPIAFTGTRPGEKLSEELVASNEALEASPVPGVKRVRCSENARGGGFTGHLEQLERLAERGRSQAVIRQLSTILPAFRPEFLAAEVAGDSRHLA